MSLLKKIGSHVVRGILPEIDELEEAPKPVAILDRKMAKQGNQAITKVLVQWSNTGPENATWEGLYALQQRFVGLTLLNA